MGAQESTSQIISPVTEPNYFSVIPGDISMLIGSHINDHAKLQQLKQLYPNISRTLTKSITTIADQAYLIPFTESLVTRATRIPAYTLLHEYPNVVDVGLPTVVSSIDQLINIARMPKLRNIHLILEGELDYTLNQTLRGKSLSKEEKFLQLVIMFIMNFLEHKSIQSAEFTKFALHFPSFGSRQGTSIDIRTNNPSDLRFYYYGCLGGLLCVNTATISFIEKNPAILKSIKTYNIPFRGVVLPEDIPTPSPQWLLGHTVYGHTDNSSTRVYEHLFSSYITTNGQVLVSYININNYQPLTMTYRLVKAGSLNRSAAAMGTGTSIRVHLTGTLPSLHLPVYPYAMSITAFELEHFDAGKYLGVSKLHLVDDMLKNSGTIHISPGFDKTGKTRKYKEELEMKYPTQVIDLDVIDPYIAISKSLTAIDLDIV